MRRNVKNSGQLGNCFAYFGTQSRFIQSTQWQQHKNSLSVENSKQKIKNKGKKSMEAQKSFLCVQRKFHPKRKWAPEPVALKTKKNTEEKYANCEAQRT